MGKDGTAVAARDVTAVPLTTKVAYRRKCLSARISRLYYNYIIVTLYIYYTITILTFLAVTFVGETVVAVTFLAVTFVAVSFLAVTFLGVTFLGVNFLAVTLCSRCIGIASVSDRVFLGSLFLSLDLYLGL